jgi:hypothetical protein
MADLLPHTSGQPAPPRPTFARPLPLPQKRLVLALVLAALSDAIGAFVAPTPPFAWGVDLITAIVLFIVLGWQWLLLPGILLEAIPGVGVLPFWVLVVVAIALWGTAHPKWTR